MKEHPDRRPLPNYSEPFVYCLGTDTKTFTIDNSFGEKQVFSDWDDIDETVIEKLTENCVTKGYIPPHFTYLLV